MTNILLVFLFIFPSVGFGEEPPEPEYPYPKTKKSKLNLEQPVKVDTRGTYYYSTEIKKKTRGPVKGIEKPYKVGDDGTYYYKTGKEDFPEKVIKGVEQPIDRDSDGSYYYNRRTGQKDRKIYGPKPDKVKPDGTFLYNAKTQASNNVLYLRLGAMTPPDIKPKEAGGNSYEDIYSNSTSFIFNAEYDWPVFSTFYLKLGSGLAIASGQGQFSGSSNPGLQPKESFQFYMFPTTVTLSYKFKLWDIQYLTPYVDAGPGYVGFVETRSDGGKTNFGGAPILSFTGGLLINLGIFGSGSSMQSDYGINETWLDLQFKQILGLDARKDFTSTLITGGFAIGF